jgi:hypothetical protein
MLQKESTKEGKSRKSPTGYRKAPTKQRILTDKKIRDRRERRSERPPESSKLTPPSSPSFDVNAPKAIGGKGSIELGSPIGSLTPLQSTFGFPRTGALFVNDLTSISIDEIPPSDYFFSRKRKVILKQEMYMKEGSMVKKNKVLIDGHNLEEEDFTTEIAGSMGAMETTNFFTVGNMRMRIKKSNNMIDQIQDQLNNAEKNISEEVSKILEQTRVAERLEIQLLKSSPDEMNQKIHVSQV